VLRRRQCVASCIEFALRLCEAALLRRRIGLHFYQPLLQFAKLLFLRARV
jgi:hypothetical protein